jgi:predicted transcriptional regulator
MNVDKRLITLAAQLTGSYVAHNSLPSSELSNLLGGVYRSLDSLGKAPQFPEPAGRLPIVPIKKTITPDAIICLESGKRFKSLTRHLRVKYGMTPKEYREKWGLPDDYPMVAPSSSEARSAFAKSIGLGRKPSE